MSVDDALRSIATDMKGLVANLRRSRPGDSRWLDSIRYRCEELGERAAELRERVQVKRQVASEALAELRVALEGYAAELAETSPRRKLTEMRAGLVRSYEDFIFQVRVVPRARESVRIPRAYRSVLHVGMGLFAASLYQFVLTREQALWVLAPVMTLFISLEVTRRLDRRWNDFLVDRVFGLISRPSERYRTNSATWYLIAMTSITIVAPKAAVISAVLVLSLGDPMAAVIGYRWGRIRLRNDKSLVGSTAFLVTATVAVLVYLTLGTPLGLLPALGVAALVAFAGTIAELFSGERIDDNFAIPVICALVALPFV